MRQTDFAAGPGDAAPLLDRCRPDELDGLVVPDYEEYCFANVPGTVASAFGVDTGRPLPADVFRGVETDVSHVVVVLLDGLGYRRWRRDADDHRFLSRLAERGTVTPLTTGCPSSTGSAIPTVHTGATAAEHGVVGWDTYVPAHDTIVELFSHAVRADVAADGDSPPCSPGEIVRADPIYPALESAGVDTAVVQPAATLGTAYADAVFDGATQCPYEDVAGGVRAVRDRLETADGATYTYLYVPHLDATSHDHGTDSGAYHDALATVTHHLSRDLFDRLDPGAASETLLAVTADHGMTDLEPGDPGCLDVLDIDGVASRLRPAGSVRSRGEGWPTGVDRVPPFGDPRLLHLAVEDGEREGVLSALEAHGATAFTRERAGDLGLFGTDDDPPLDGRFGDVVFTHPDRKLLHPALDRLRPKVGVHGGLTPAEMVVPFAAARLSRVQ